MDDSTITCDEIIKEKSKASTKNFNKEMQSEKQKNLYFTCFFINYYCIIDSCQYSLLSDCYLKQSKKTYYHFMSQVRN